MNFVRHDDVPEMILKNGTKANLRSWNDQFTIIHAVRPTGVLFPVDQHPEIQIYIIVKGKIELTVGDETHILTDGDTWIVDSNIPHIANVIEETEEYEVFYPARQDLVERYLNQ